MARPNLKSAAQKRAASKVASKVAKRQNSKSNSLTKPLSPTPPPNENKPATSASNISTVIPGLSALLPDSVSGMLPEFNDLDYAINNPLAPPETLPQVSETQYSKAESTYQGALRALKLTGMAFDVADTRFTVIGKRAKAFGSGIKTATAIERVKGDYLDYQNQVETTNQKMVALENNQAKTINERSISAQSQAVMNEKLKQAENDAEMARQKTAEKQNQLAEFKKQLGEYLPSN